MGQAACQDSGLWAVHLCVVGAQPRLTSCCLDSALGAGAHLISLLELFIPDPLGELNAGSGALAQGHP